MFKKKKKAYWNKVLKRNTAVQLALPNSSDSPEDDLKDSVTFITFTIHI